VKSRQKEWAATAGVYPFMHVVGKSCQSIKRLKRETFTARGTLNVGENPQRQKLKGYFSPTISGHGPIINHLSLAVLKC